MTFWLHRFRKLDVRQQSHRKMLIDAFINAIFLYDDKMVITFNYKEGTKTITFAELQEAISNKNGSDLDCLAAPIKELKISSFLIMFWRLQRLRPPARLLFYCFYKSLYKTFGGREFRRF